MAYSTDILNLSATHHWKLDGNSLDAIGVANGTDTAIIYTNVAVAEDAVNCATTDAIGDRISIPTTTDINNSAQTRKAVAGWFLTTALNDPPKRIYGEGNEVQSFAFIMGWGNNVIFEVDDPNFTLQIFADTFLVPNRAYHLALIFEGNGFGNVLRAYLDGVKQLSAEPVNSQPNSASLTARSVAEFGDPAGIVAVGGKIVLLNSPVNGKYNHWATWDGAAAVLSDVQVRQELFEKGALPDITILSGTEAVMQTALDVYSGTVRGDSPLCIRVEDSTSGDFTLTLSNITFDPLASIHIQYTGNDQLTLLNTNGSNCSIVSTPALGSITLKTQVTLTINTLDVSTGSIISDVRVFMEADTGGDLVVGTEIVNSLSVSGIVSSSFYYTADQPVIGRVAKGTSLTYYKSISFSGTITKDGILLTILLEED